MVRLYVRHNVSDYAKWRKVYDEFSGFQTAHGVTAKAVYQSLDDPSDVTVWHDFDTAEAAHAFAGDAEVRDTMAAAGVQGTPQLWFTQKR
jgi:hypothetical protein